MVLSTVSSFSRRAYGNLLPLSSHQLKHRSTTTTLSLVIPVFQRASIYCYSTSTSSSSTSNGGNNDLPGMDNIEEVIIDANAAKGVSDPILVHSKTDSKSIKSGKTTAA